MVDAKPARRGSFFAQPKYKLELWGPLVLYLLVAAWQAHRLPDNLNPDTIPFLRNAEYILQGRLSDSVSGYWNPLYTWSIVPLEKLGVDAVYAAKIVVIAWGLLAVLGSYCFLRGLVKKVTWTGAAALLIVAIDLGFFAARYLQPDLILSACLLFYVALTLSPNLPKQPWRQIAAGAAAGFAYLAKSYAFPFFLAHYTLTVLHDYFTAKSPRWPAQYIRTWLVGLLTFGVLAGPWIGVLTEKYGHFTVSTSAGIQHALVGPPDVDRTHTWDRKLYSVPEGRISMWETPEDTPYHYWSPLESRANFVYQIKSFLAAASKLIKEIDIFDLLSMTLVALVFTPLMLLRPGSAESRRKAEWVLGTIACYSAGFMLVFVQWRYIHSFLFPICCVFCLAFSLRMMWRMAARSNVGARAKNVMVALAILSFFGGTCARYALAPPELHEGSHQQRDWAQQLREAGAQGSLAALDTNSSAYVLYTCYYLNLPFSGAVDPNDLAKQDVHVVERALKLVGVRTLLVPVDEQWKWFCDQTSWKHLTTLKAPTMSMEVYVATDHAAQADRSGNFHVLKSQVSSQ